MPRTFLTISLTRMPPKIRPSPQLSSDVIMEKNTTKATAPRGVRGTFASFRINLCTGGDVATTNPPMIIIAICIVNGISPQNPSPKYLIRFRIPTPANNPATNTIISPTRANTNASGNHFWDQSASPIPNRANTPAESSPASCIVFRFGVDPMRPFQTGQVAMRDRLGVCPAENLDHYLCAASCLCVAQSPGGTSFQAPEMLCKNSVLVLVAPAFRRACAR